MSTTRSVRAVAVAVAVSLVGAAVGSRAGAGPIDDTRRTADPHGAAHLVLSDEPAHPSGA